MSPLREDETTTRQEQKKAARAALTCFEEAGYASTQIAHITEKAGVAKGTFHVHFADKDELLDEVLVEFNDGFVERVRPLCSPENLRQPRELTRQIAEIFLDYWQEHRGFIRAYSEKTAGGVGLQTLQFGLNGWTQVLLSAALMRTAADLGVPLPNLDLVIQGILAMWLRLGLQALFNPSVRRAEVIDTLEKMTTGALAGVLPGLLAEKGSKKR